MSTRTILVIWRTHGICQNAAAHKTLIARIMQRDGAGAFVAVKGRLVRKGMLMPVRIHTIKTKDNVTHTHFQTT